MPAQIGFYDTLKSTAGKVFAYLASITLTGTDGKTITVTQDTSLDEAVAMSSKAPKASPTFTTKITTPIIDLTGGQIAFPAAQAASADPNTLDDYEEGTWTVTVTCGTSGTVTLGANAEGAYTKIGRHVHVQGYFAVSSVSSPVGEARINLPFTAANLTNNSGASIGSVSFYAVNFVGTGWTNVLVGEAVAYMRLLSTNDNAAYTFESADIFTADDECYFQLSYIV